MKKIIQIILFLYFKIGKNNISIFKTFFKKKNIYVYLLYKFKINFKFKKKKEEVKKHTKKKFKYNIIKKI